jgi:hypothetical protein
MRRDATYFNVVVLVLLKQGEEDLHDLLLVVPHLLTLRLSSSSKLAKK